MEKADMLSRQPDYNQGENNNDPPQQDKGIIQQWAGTHDLKKKNGEWWKGQCKVITGNNEERRKIIQAYHDLPAYGYPGIN